MSFRANTNFRGSTKSDTTGSGQHSAESRPFTGRRRHGGGGGGSRWWQVIERLPATLVNNGFLIDGSVPMSHPVNITYASVKNAD